MGVVALASVKGAPGVTTAAVGLAARWPAPVLLVEADPAGGDLAARFGVHRSPGVPEWAADSRLASARLGPISARVENYARDLPGLGVPVLLGGTADQMPTALSLLATSQALASIDSADLLLDVGRLDPSQSGPALVAGADVVLLVTSPWPEAIDALLARRDRLARLLEPHPALGSRAPRLGLLLVGDSPYSPGEVQDAVGLPVFGALPTDPAGAEVLCGRRRPGRAWTRTPLLRACRTLAAGMGEVLGEGRASGPATDRVGA